MTKTLSFAVALAAAGLVAPAAHAATNIGFGTGTDTTSGVDNNWTVNNGSAFVPTTGLPGTYAPNTATGRWITPIAGAGTAAPGIYNFRGVVNLSDVGNVQSWNLTWWADNIVRNIIVNGVSLFSNPGGSSGAQEFVGAGRSMLFTQAVWKNGSNDVEFVIENGAGNSGNPVALKASSMINAVPEPGTWMLMILGLGAVGFAMRRRRSTSVRFQFA